MGKGVVQTLLLSAVVLVFTACASSLPIEQFEAYRSANEERVGKLELELSRMCETQEQFMDEASVRALIDEIGTTLGLVRTKLSEIETVIGTLAPKEDVTALEERVGTMVADYNAAKQTLGELARLAGYEEPVQLAQLGRDIIDVNRNIAGIDAKIEHLRAAMALFAGP